MKCVNCGAEIDPHSDRCEYCGSYIEREEKQEKSSSDEYKRQAVENISGSISKVIKWIGIAILAMIVLPTIISVVAAIVMLVANKDAFVGNHSKSSLPVNTDMVIGKLEGIDRDGQAQIYYQNNRFENVKVTDTEAIAFISDTFEKIDDIDICFDVDSKGNITSIRPSTGLMIAVAKEGDEYLASSEIGLLSVRCAKELEEETLYTGYLSVADREVVKVFESDDYYMGTEQIFLRVDNKREKEVKDVWGETHKVYQIYSENLDWGICSKNVYEKIQIEDSLEGYLHFQSLGLFTMNRAN